MTFRSTLLVILVMFTMVSIAIVYAPPQDNNPPVIETPTIQPATPGPGESVTINVTVTDQHSGVKNVTVVYTTDNWQSVNSSITMDYNATSRVALVQMPTPFGGGHVAFYIVAFDLEGNRAVNDNNGTYYAYDLPSPIGGPVTTTTIAYIGVLAMVGAAIALMAYMILKKRPSTTAGQTAPYSGTQEPY